MATDDKHHSISDQIYRRLLNRAQDGVRFRLLVAWLRDRPGYPAMPSRLDLQNKIEELLGEKL